MGKGRLAGGTCLIALGACVALAGPRVEPVVITYAGDTVLTRGTTVAAIFGVTANGASLPNPRLVLASSNPAIVALTAVGDSLTAQAIGRCTLTVRLESSILSDSAPTLSQPIRVRP